MLEMRAIVMSVRGEEAEISPLGGGGCGHCDSEKGCGSGKLTKMFCSSEVRKFLVRNELGAQVGDEVNVSLPEGALLLSSWRMYLLPLLLLLGGGLMGASLAGETASRDGYALMGSMTGLVSGFVWGRFSSTSDKPQAVVQSIISPRVNS